MISSKNYQSGHIIRQFFLNLKTLPNYIIVLSGGNTMGGDPIIRKIALEMGLGYKEYNPFHSMHNIYSAYPAYRYSKKFSPGNFASRYSDLIKNCDRLVVFQDINSSDTFIESIVKQINKDKIQKPAVVIYE